MKQFKFLQGVAKQQKCVLEKTGKVHRLYSNKTFTEGEFTTLKELSNALYFDESFC